MSVSESALASLQLKIRLHFFLKKVTPQFPNQSGFANYGWTILCSILVLKTLPAYTGDESEQDYEDDEGYTSILLRENVGNVVSLCHAKKFYDGTIIKELFKNR